MTDRPDRLILVYDADSGVRAMLADVLKKLVGREECALCEITYGAAGKRRAWAACEKRLRLIVDELHRDRIPHEWKLTRSDLPCILARRGAAKPFVLLTRREIADCGGSAEQLEQGIVDALQTLSQNSSECRST